MTPQDKNESQVASQETEDKIEVNLPENEQALEESQAALARLRIEHAVLKEEHLRQWAEQINFQKRQNQQFETQKKFATERQLKALLPIIDSLEEALKQGSLSSEVNSGSESLLRGVEATLQLFREFMKKEGVEIIEACHVPFDPDQHHVMELSKLPHSKANEVLKIFQKGYRLEARLLRPAMVCISGHEAEEAS